MLIFAEGGKPENPEKNPRSEDENQQQTQPTYGTGPESNPGHIGGRRVLSPLRHPRSLNLTWCPSTLPGVLFLSFEVNIERTALWSTRKAKKMHKVRFQTLIEFFKGKGIYFQLNFKSIQSPMHSTLNSTSIGIQG